MFITFLLLGNDVISLELVPFIFPYSCAHTQSIQKHVIKYNIKSKYTEEYSTVDKVEHEKLSVQEVMFREELITSSFLT